MNRLLVSLETVAFAAGAALLTGTVISVAQKYDDRCLKDDVEEREDGKDERKPPYNGSVLGNDSSVCPLEGFKWQGKDGPGGKRGNWYNEQTYESLHPDLEHPEPIKPHWDYMNPRGRGARLYLDGSWEWKS